MTTQYTVDYFLNKFENVPDEIWGTNNFLDNGKMCALGQCGYRDAKPATEEGRALSFLFDKLGISCHNVTNINDTQTLGFNQETPKQRILAALRYIKCLQSIKS